jgi:adenine phosphoribosyltransferase
MNLETLEKNIKVVENFPKPGVNFLDMSGVLEDGPSFNGLIDLMCEQYASQKVDKIIAIESRGFILGAAMAQKLGAGLVMVRKRGKLPGATLSVSYELEYGTDQLEILTESIRSGEKVLIVDDVLATGGTAHAAYQLCEKLHADIIGFSFFIEIVFLDGRMKLQKPVQSLLKK